ncbi:MAG: rimK [Chloroflexi bacterium]|nr:rimK [Chloroflexota bacterium]
MQIDIIGFENANAVRLRDRLKSRGHTARVIPAEDLYLDLCEGRNIVVPYDTLPLPDVVVSLTSTDTVSAFEALQVLVDAGVPVINQAAALEKSANKFRTALALGEAGVRHPRVIQVCTQKALEEAARRVGFPLVIKAHDGSEGNTVFLVKQESELIRQFARMRRVYGMEITDRSPVLIQEFMAESVGRDKRVFVVGGVAVAGMERVAQPGEWRSNLSQGAYPHATVLTEEETAVAMRSVLALGLDFGVVDVMPVSGGPAVIEVNSGGDFVDIVAMSGIDIVEVLCRYIESKGGEGEWNPLAEELPLLDSTELEREVKFAWDRIARKAEELALQAKKEALSNVLKG